jgi:hypothetical protein
VGNWSDQTQLQLRTERVRRAYRCGLVLGALGSNLSRDTVYHARVFPSFPPVPEGKCWDNPIIRPLPFPFRSLPLHSSIISSLDATQSAVLNAS